MSKLKKKADGRLFAGVVLMSLLLAAFTSCSTESGTVKKTVKNVMITGMTLSWTAPTTYTDGSALTVSSYKLYYGTASGSYSGSRTISSSATSFDGSQVVTVRGVTYYFVLTALDASGAESDPSNEVSAFVQS